MSNDMVCIIRRKKQDIVQTVAPEVDSVRVPHSVDTNIFKNKSNEPESLQFKNTIIKDNSDKVIFFWNNRNARRKQSGTLIWWFKEFLDEIGHDKACLVMHTEPRDPHGQNLFSIIEELGLSENQVLFSTDKIHPEKLASLYSAVDCTINISDAEGFGLATLESLACETPVIVSMTGGLQEQVTDGEKWFGFGIEPASKSIIGSQDVPYIYEDRISKEDFLNCMRKFMSLKVEERNQLGALGRQHVLNEYGFNKYEESWVNIMDNLLEKHGSWSARKNYKPWNFEEIV